MSRVRGRRLGRGGAGLALALAVSGCGLIGGGGGEPQIAADVEGTTITSAQVNQLYEVFARTEAGQQALGGGGSGEPGSSTLEPKQIRQTALSYQIKVAFLTFLGARENVAVPEDASKDEVYDALASIGSLQVAGYRGQDLKVAARIEAISKAIAARLLPEASVTDAELKAAYADRKDLVGKSFRATTDIAFMGSEAAADALKTALDAGQDFAASTAALGEATLEARTVDINPITPIQADLIEKVRTLDAGRTADPISYDVDGAALFVVLHQRKRVDLPALTLTEATPELTKAVIDHKRFVVFDDWLGKQYLAARIDVDPYYGRWDPSFRAVV